MGIDRRELLRGAVLGLAVGAAISAWPRAASALTADEAASFVQDTINEVADLLESSSGAPAKAARLRAIMERRAAMPEIARFVAGPAWRGMNEEQQSRFVAAFTGFISAVYAERFQEYSGDAKKNDLFRMGRVIDAGRKGLLVRTSINAAGESPVSVEWLVTDRPGRVVIADIVIEGVSLLVTQRAEIGSMLEARNGDIDRLIDHLASA